MPACIFARGNRRPCLRTQGPDPERGVHDAPLIPTHSYPTRAFQASLDLLDLFLADYSNQTNCVRHLTEPWTFREQRISVLPSTQTNIHEASVVLLH